ncbi:nucleotidyl transferase AbiEii/AbiGii toxin family protein [Anoxynatronum buryatiense]
MASSHAEQFIFKGGFILSNIIGISQRTTVDMDVLLRD